MNQRRYRSLGVIGKFQPVHKGHKLLLESMIANADEVLVGIGTRERPDSLRPFRPFEVREMLELVLRPIGHPYHLIEIPDTGHLPGYEDGALWREHVREAYGSVDAIVSGNPYVHALLSDTFALITPEELIRVEERQPLCGSLVRSSIAIGKAWEEYLPYSVALYIRNHGLDERLRQEFGTELSQQFPTEQETIASEIRKIRGY